MADRISVFYDEHGMVIATEGLETPYPWEVRQSSKFAGRFYFFDLERNKSAWSLEPSVLGFSPAGESKKMEASVETKQEAKSEGGLKKSFSMVSLLTGGGGSSTKDQGGKSPKTQTSMFSKFTSSLKSSKSNGDIAGMAGEEESAGEGSKMKPTLSGRQALNTGLMSPGTSGGGMTRVTSFGTLPHAGRDDVEVNLKERLGGGVNLEDGSSTLQIIEGLGQGGYAYVLKAKHVKTGDILALKVVPKKNAPRKRDRERLKLELEVMTALSPSPFVQRCLLAFESATHLYVGLELVGGGDLFFHLVKNITAHGWGFPEDEARVLLAETVLALTHLHDQGFVHRDVKVENIMLDSRGHVKLIDFGLASQLTRPEETFSPTGSLIYMAPEILTDQLGGRHTDWWALGVLSYELMTGRTPWSSLTDKKVIRKEIRALKVMPPRRLSPAAGLFICSLLKHDRALRLGTKDDRELQAHKFFASVDWAATARQESAPALVPSGPVTNERDRLAVLAAYCRSTDQAAGGRGENEEWYLGLDQVRQDLPAESY